MEGLRVPTTAVESMRIVIEMMLSAGPGAVRVGTVQSTV